MNQVILVGRLAQDVELRYIAGTGTPVATFTVAVEREFTDKNGKREVDFINIQTWGKQAETCSKYIGKGSMVSIQGSLRVEKYEAKDGTKRYVTEVVADMFNGVSFLSKGNGNNSSTGNSNPGNDNNDAFGDMGFDSDMTPVDDGSMPF